jgi:hypothetical protein
MAVRSRTEKLLTLDAQLFLGFGCAQLENFALQALAFNRFRNAIFELWEVLAYALRQTVIVKELQKRTSGAHLSIRFTRE